MDIKLIAIDMDGTLLYDFNTIKPRVKEAVRAVVEKGIKVVISTGRIHPSANYYTKLIGLSTPIISCNGALVKEKDTIIHKKTIDDNSLENILSILEEYEDVYFHMYSEDAYIAKRDNKSVEIYTKWNEQMDEEDQIKIEIFENYNEFFKNEKEIYKMFIVKGNASEKRFKEVIEKINSVEGVYCVSSMEGSMDVINIDVSKGRAVQYLADKYGIARENIMAIGDNYNDLDMIKYAGIGVAMGNADEEIKRYADFITNTNLEDGVAVAIEKFCL